MTVAHLPSPAPARVGYAVGRPVGNAVVRNRVRRRLREIVRGLDAATELPGGAYLVSVTPDAATVPFATLRTAVATAVERVTASAGRR